LETGRENFIGNDGRNSNLHNHLRAVSIVAGTTVKTFYRAKGMFGAMDSGHQVARWKGRLFFIVAGIFLTPGRDAVFRISLIK
jgi:hypothetical protein